MMLVHASQRMGAPGAETFPLALSAAQGQSVLALTEGTGPVSSPGLDLRLSRRASHHRCIALRAGHSRRPGGAGRRAEEGGAPWPGCSSLQRPGVGCGAALTVALGRAPQWREADPGSTRATDGPRCPPKLRRKARKARTCVPTP